MHSLKCLKNPHSKVSANTIERNWVQKEQHRSLGSCLADPSFPRETLELAVGRAPREWLRQQFPLRSRRQRIQKEQRTDIKKRHAPQSGQVDRERLSLLKKQEASVQALLGLPSSLFPGAQHPSGEAVAQPLARRFTVTSEAAQT